MPWCETCDRFYNPNTLQADGTCPTCGRQVVDPVSTVSAVSTTRSEEESVPGAPWHFKALIAVTAGYLSYRLFQGIVWVGHHL